MRSILFVCFANICRSPMAEYVMAHLVAQAGLAGEFHINSAGTSDVGIGEYSHPGTQEKLRQQGIPVYPHTATQITTEDYQTYDYILAMDEANLADMHAIFGQDPQHKLYRLLDFTPDPKNVTDPWYTKNFDTTYDEILAGCQAFLAHLIK